MPVKSQPPGTRSRGSTRTRSTASMPASGRKVRSDGRHAQRHRRRLAGIPGAVHARARRSGSRTRPATSSASRPGAPCAAPCRSPTGSRGAHRRPRTASAAVTTTMLRTTPRPVAIGSVTNSFASAGSVPGRIPIVIPPAPCAPREAARITPPRPPVITTAPPRASSCPTSSAHSRIRCASGPLRIPVADDRNVRRAGSGGRLAHDAARDPASVIPSGALARIS